MKEEERKNARKLLDKVEGKVSELKYDAAFSFPNIFIMEDIVYDERRMCKFLSRLLNAKYNPKYGTQMIVSFLTDVMHFDKETIGDEKSWTSLREYMIPNGKRIDIVLVNWDRGLFIPIEAKIDAKDRTNQCKDYLEYAKTKYYFDGLKLGYLTLSGGMPSDKSYSRQDGGDIIPITWEGIGKWLNEFIDGNDDSNFKFCVSQFCNAIKMFTAYEEEVAVMKSIIKNKNDYESAVFINAHLNEVKVYKMKDFFAKVEKSIADRLKDETIIDEIELWGGYSEAIDNYYGKRRKCPGLTYSVEKEYLKTEYREALGDDLGLAIRIEVDENLYIGLCCPYIKEGRESSKISVAPQNKEELIKIFDLKNGGKHGDPKWWWLNWKHVMVDGATLNFRYDGEKEKSAIYKLFENEDKCVERTVDLFFDSFFKPLKEKFIK